MRTTLKTKERNEKQKKRNKIKLAREQLERHKIDVIFFSPVSCTCPNYRICVNFISFAIKCLWILYTRWAEEKQTNTVWLMREISCRVVVPFSFLVVALEQRENCQIGSPILKINQAKWEVYLHSFPSFAHPLHPHCWRGRTRTSIISEFDVVEKLSKRRRQHVHLVVK